MTPPLLQTLALHKYDIDRAAFSPDGSRLAAAGSPRDYAIRILDTATWKKIHSLRGHKSRITAFAFSPDGRLLASASADKTVKLWDLQTGELQGTMTGHRKVVFTVAFSPEGRTLASGGMDGMAIVTDAATCTEIRRSKPFGGSVISVAYSPDGSTIAVAGGTDRSVAGLCLWDFSTGAEKRWPSGHRAQTLWIAWSPDGKTIGSATYGEIILRDAESGVPRLRFRTTSGPTVGFDFSPDGRTIAANGSINALRPDHEIDHQVSFGLIQFWDALTGRLITEFVGHDKQSPAVSFSPQVGIVATGSLDGTVKIWDISQVLANGVGATGDSLPSTFRIHAYCHRSVSRVTPAHLAEGIRERLRLLTYLFCPDKEEDPDAVLQRLTVTDASCPGVTGNFAIHYRSDSPESIWMNRIEDRLLAMPLNDLVILGWHARNPNPGASAAVRELLLGTTERVTFFLTAQDVEGMGFPLAIAAASYLVQTVGGVIQSGDGSWMVPDGKEVTILGEWPEET